MACYECNNNKGLFDAEEIYGSKEDKKGYPLSEFVKYNKRWRKLWRKTSKLLKIKQ